MARHKHIMEFHSVSMVSPVASTDSKPKDICLQKSAGSGMEEVAIKAAVEYSLQPALEGDRTPVFVSFIVSTAAVSNVAS